MQVQFAYVYIHAHYVCMYFSVCVRVFIWVRGGDPGADDWVREGKRVSLWGGIRAQSCWMSPGFINDVPWGKQGLAVIERFVAQGTFSSSVD